MFISIEELIKKSYNLYKNNFVIILKYLLLMLIPAIAICLLMELALTPAIIAGSAMGPIIFVLIPILLLALLAFTIAGIWLNFALIKVIDLLNKKTTVPTMKEVLKDTKTVIWRGFGATILVGIYTAWPFFLGLLALAISNMLLSSKILYAVCGLVVMYGIFHLVYFSIKLIFAVYSTVLDNKKIKEAVLASKSLTDKRWWGIVGRILVPMLVAYVILMIVTIILATFGQFGGDTGKWVTVTFQLIINLIATPYALAVMIILFDEAKKTPVLTAPQA